MRGFEFAGVWAVHLQNFSAAVFFDHISLAQNGTGDKTTHGKGHNEREVPPAADGLAEHVILFRRVHPANDKLA